MNRLATTLVSLGMLLSGAVAASAASAISAADFPELALTQNLGKRLPLDVALTDQTGRRAPLGALFHGRPVLLLFGYFHCPNLCGLARAGLVRALRQIGGLAAGRDFEIAVISVDPREGRSDAIQAEQADLGGAGTSEAARGWHYLFGSEQDLRRLAEAAGFHFRYDAQLDQYAHPTGLMVATPDGHLARYLEGISYRARDVRLALVEASRGTIAAPAARLLLLCYCYDPATGRYSILIGRLMIAVGLLTIAALGLLIALAARPRRAG